MPLAPFERAAPFRGATLTLTEELSRFRDTLRGKRSYAVGFTLT